MNFYLSTKQIRFVSGILEKNEIIPIFIFCTLSCGFRSSIFCRILIYKPGKYAISSSNIMMYLIQNIVRYKLKLLDVYANI